MNAIEIMRPIGFVAHGTFGGLVEGRQENDAQKYLKVNYMTGSILVKPTSAIMDAIPAERTPCMVTGDVYSNSRNAILCAANSIFIPGMAEYSEPDFDAVVNGPKFMGYGIPKKDGFRDKNGDPRYRITIAAHGFFHALECTEELFRSCPDGEKALSMIEGYIKSEIRYNTQYNYHAQVMDLDITNIQLLQIKQPRRREQDAA